MYAYFILISKNFNIRQYYVPAKFSFCHNIIKLPAYNPIFSSSLVFVRPRMRDFYTSRCSIKLSCPQFAASYVSSKQLRARK